MDWCDLDDILYDGTEEEIKAARCPECSGKISFRYSAAGDFRVECTRCGTYTLAYKSPVPNCAKFFGNSVNNLGHDTKVK